MAITQILSHPQLDRRVIRVQGLPRPQRDSRTGTVYQKIHCKPLQGFSTPLIRTWVDFFLFSHKSYHGCGTGKKQSVLQCWQARNMGWEYEIGSQCQEWWVNKLGRFRGTAWRSAGEHGICGATGGRITSGSKKGMEGTREKGEEVKVRGAWSRNCRMRDAMRIQLQNLTLSCQEAFLVSLGSGGYLVFHYCFTDLFCVPVTGFH